MNRIAVVALAFALSLSGSPLFAAARAGRVARLPGGTLSGTATSSTGQTLAQTTVQLRDLATGQIFSTTQSAANGAFSFVGLPAGNFAVEVVSAAGQIIGTSASISVVAGATITGVTVSASAAAALETAAGAAAAGVATAGGFSRAVVVTSVAAAAGVAGTIAVITTASSSR